MTRRACWLFVAALLLESCQTAKAPTPAPRGPLRCHAEAAVVSTKPVVLEVVERCTGRAWTGFRANEDESLAYFSGVNLELKGNVFELPPSTADAVVRYRIDLDQVAKQADSFD